MSRDFPQQERRLCVVHPSRQAYSETFIRDHIRLLRGSKTVLSGGVFPTEVDGRLMVSGPARFAEQLAGKLGGPARRQALEQARLSRLLRKSRVDIVLAEYGPTGSQVYASCEQAGVPLVVHFHGQDAFDRGMLDRYGEQYRAMFRSVAGIIVGTEEMRLQVLHLGAQIDQVHVNPCGVDVDRFQPVNAAINPALFVAVGRFVEKKAPQLTLLAFDRVLSTYPKARLIMIGDGPLLDCCKQMADALGLKESVMFMGSVNQDRVIEVLAGARCFIQHSVAAPSGDREGTSISVLEASASGLPVVATRHGGISMSVVHESTGFLVDEYDIQGMARYMQLILERPELASDLGQRGRKRMTEHYSMQLSIRRLDAILDESVRSSSRGIRR